MATDTDLRASLTHALLPYLPPELVAPAVDAATRIERVPERTRSGTPESWVMSQLWLVLPEPYRSAAAIAEAIAPVVAAWWASRPVEAGSLTVRDERP